MEFHKDVASAFQSLHSSQDRRRPIIDVHERVQRGDYIQVSEPVVQAEAAKTFLHHEPIYFGADV
jgi:hypothetical protein